MLEDFNKRISTINAPRKDVPLGIVVVNYKSHDETVNFVEKELAKIATPHVVVVVNNSDDGPHGRKLAEALHAEHYHSSQIEKVPNADRIVVSEPENLGYGRGNNLGFEFIDRHFDTRWVLISNNDLELKDQDVVSSLMEVGESNSSIGLIGPKVRTPQNNDQSPHRYKSIWTMLIFPKLIYPVWAVFRRLGWGKEVVANANTGFYFRIMGCFFLVRTEAFRKAEGFDDRTFMYGEEAILSVRFRQHGFESYYFADRMVIHHHRQTTSNYFSKRKTKQHVLRSMLIFYQYYDQQPEWVCKLALFADWMEAKVYEPLIRLPGLLRRTRRLAD